MKKILFFILFLYSIDVTYSQEKVTDSLQSKALEEQKGVCPRCHCQVLLLLQTPYQKLE